MSRVAYLDSSAFVKLLVPERETSALRRTLKMFDHLVSSAVLKVEVVRAVRLVDPSRAQEAAEATRSLRLIAADDQLIDSAMRLDPPTMRTLDSIHVASALCLGDDLAALITYDARMSEAAKVLGLPVQAPR